MKNCRQKGNIAESKAQQYLLSQGFVIVECNYYTQYGEIDIIATKDNIYHFIEVKSGKNFEPLQNVTSKKLEKIYKTLSLYLSQNQLDVVYCVDIITIRNDEIDFFGNVSLQVMT